jgi:hypothetical protein
MSKKKTTSWSCTYFNSSLLAAQAARPCLLVGPSTFVFAGLVVVAIVVIAAVAAKRDHLEHARCRRIGQPDTTCGAHLCTSRPRTTRQRGECDGPGEPRRMGLMQLPHFSSSTFFFDNP